MTVLAIRALRVAYGDRIAVADLSLTVAAGEIVALVGESGSGKSTVAAAAIGLLPPDAATGGEIWIGDVPMTAASEAQRDRLRGGAVAMVFQEPRTALNPIQRVRAQVAETLATHRGLGRREARGQAVATLGRVGLTATQAGRYPHQLSGGQRQRAAIAIAIAAGPRLLIADEPTTALDATVQAQIVALLRRLVDEDGMGLLLISHDLPLIAQVADRVIVMRDGGMIEDGDIADVLARPRHPYTRRLLAAAAPAPATSARVPRAAGRPPLLMVEGLTQAHRAGWCGPAARLALDDVGFVVERGETVGIIGESGAGKTSLLRAVLALDRPRSGDVRIDGESILQARGAALRRLRRKVQAVFQDPAASLDPRQRVGRIVAEPLHLLDERLDAAGIRGRVGTMLDRVGLSAADADRFPHQFSGGQRQRIAIARALIVEPALVVLDEAVSGLDAALRAEILDLLAALSDTMGLAYLFVSHDLAMMRRIADRLIVMKDGRIVEQGRTADIVAAPSHPYTAALLVATPDLGRVLAARGSGVIDAARDRPR